MPVDVLARAVARISLVEEQRKTVYYAPDLRKWGRAPAAKPGLQVAMSLSTSAAPMYRGSDANRHLAMPGTAATRSGEQYP